MKIGFIGCGQITNAMISGLKGGSVISFSDIAVYDRNPGKIEALTKDTDIQAASDPIDLVEKSHLVFLSVRPKDAVSLCEEIGEALKDKVVIFMSPGAKLSKLATLFPEGTKITRILPNTPLEVREGMTSVAFNDFVQEDEKRLLLDIFNDLGSAAVIEESQFAIFSAIAGSGPAYAYYFIEALMEAAELHGVSHENAKLFATQTLLGGSKLALESRGQEMAEMIDQIASLGTSSIEAMNIFRASDFKDITANAVGNALKKNLEWEEDEGRV